MFWVWSIALSLVLGTRAHVLDAQDVPHWLLNASAVLTKPEWTDLSQTDWLTDAVSAECPMTLRRLNVSSQFFQMMVKSLQDTCCNWQRQERGGTFTGAQAGSRKALGGWGGGYFFSHGWLLLGTEESAGQEEPKAVCYLKASTSRQCLIVSLFLPRVMRLEERSTVIPDGGLPPPECQHRLRPPAMAGAIRDARSLQELMGQTRRI